MKRNIEIKARCADLEAARRTVRGLGAALEALERQEDTYFRSARGRLKLRRRWVASPAAGGPLPSPGDRDAEKPGQLIWYQRADDSGPRPSDYLLVALGSAEELLGLLSAALGVAAVVAKDRAIYLHQNVRIHLAWIFGFLEPLAWAERLAEAEAQLPGRRRERLGAITAGDIFVAIKDAGAFGPQAYWTYAEDPNAPRTPRAAERSPRRPRGSNNPG